MDWRRLSSHNAETATGGAALFLLMTWMRDRRHAHERRTIALRGGVGVLAAAVYTKFGTPGVSREFWNTAQYLLSTYGAYEAFQLVRFNLDFWRSAGNMSWMMNNDELEVSLRPNSRMLLSRDLFDGEDLTEGVYSFSGVNEMWLMLKVMAAALLAERLKLRRMLNNTPLAALGLYRLTMEKPVSRSRR